MEWFNGLFPVIIHFLSESLARARALMPRRTVPAREFVQVRDLGCRLVDEGKWAEALSALDHGLRLAPRDGLQQQADLHFRKGYVLEQMGQLQAALAEYGLCRGLEERVGKLELSPIVAFRRGHVLAQLGRRSEAEPELRRAVQEAQGASVPDLELNAWRVLLGVYQSTRQYDKAVEAAQQAAHLAATLGDARTEALLLDGLGDAYLGLGRPEDALHSYERSLDRFCLLDDCPGEWMVQRDIARLFQQEGHPGQAQAWLQACLAQKERAENLVCQAHICYEMGCLLVSDGELDAAANLLVRSLGLFRRINDRGSVEQVGRTLMGLGILLQRSMSEGRLTFRDIERGSRLKKEGGD